MVSRLIMAVLLWHVLIVVEIFVAQHGCPYQQTYSRHCYTQLPGEVIGSRLCFKAQHQQRTYKGQRRGVLV